MPTVYLRADPEYRTRFHRTASCPQLIKPPARGDGHEIVALDLDEVSTRPCHTCYSDAPLVKIRKAYCPQCNRKSACPHNGGIQVISHASWLGDRRIWVWPDANRIRSYDIAV